MTQKLSTNKIPYRLADNGQQILVPQADVYQQRLDMAASGLPSTGNQGYSLLDSAGVTTSQFQQQIEYQQAVSDEYRGDDRIDNRRHVGTRKRGHPATKLVFHRRQPAKRLGPRKPPARRHPLGRASPSDRTPRRFEH